MALGDVSIGPALTPSEREAFDEWCAWVFAACPAVLGTAPIPNRPGCVLKAKDGRWAFSPYDGNTKGWEYGRTP